MTNKNPNSIGESYYNSRLQLLYCLGRQNMELINTVGLTGSMSLTDLIGTLMQWYDTSSQKDKIKFWTLIVDYLILPTPYGTPSRGRNSIARLNSD